MRPTRLIASVSAALVTAASLTVPSMALAADSGGADDRIVLQPAATQDETKPDAEAKPASDQASAKAKARGNDDPPISRARPIADLREAAKCTSDTGRSWVVVNGPGDVRVAGWAQCVGRAWTLDVTTGSGHIGGMTLQASDFSGRITIPRAAKPTSDVRVRLPWGASTLPKGDASAYMSLFPAGRDLAGTVTVVDAAKAGRIDMSGPVRDDGTFTLKASGDVLFAKSAVLMTGVYRSGSNAVRGRGTEPTWALAGTAPSVKVPGATFDRARLTMSNTTPGVQGTSRVSIEQYKIVSPVRIALVDGTSWNATLLGADAGPRKDARLPGLTLMADGATGSISATRGQIRWNVRMPMALVDGALALRGNATLIGPAKLRLAPTSGVGDIYGTGQPAVFTQAAGSMVLEGRKASGRMAIGSVGEQLVDMPEGWTSVSVLELTPRFGAGPAATLERSLKYVMTDRTSQVTLSGSLPTAGPFILRASGHLGIGSTKVPVQGRYIGAGPRDTSTPGKLLITANTDRAPKGYADLGSGARAQDTTFIVSTDSSASSVTRSVTSRALSLPTVTVKSKNNTSSTGGTVTLQVSGIDGTNQSITFTANWTYTPATNGPPAKAGYYTVSIKGTGSAYWEPYEGLRIPYSSISGSITADDSTHVTSWYIDVNPAVTWNVGDGITLTSSFRFSTTCTQDMAKTCPSPAVPGTFFISGKSSILNVPVMAGVTIPALSAYGAFRSDGLWARWDAEVTGGQAITVEGPADSSISLTQAQVALFSSAQREDTAALPANLQMPDLSALSEAGMNVQACGSFKIVIFEISTGNVPGCVALTKKGKVVAQTNTGGTTGGAVSPLDNHDENGDGKGLTLDSSKPPTVNGYAYSDIDPKSTPTKTDPTVKLYNRVISLAPKVNNFTVNVPIPASLMESFGTGTSQDTTLLATGFFAPKTNELYIDLDIPVNLKAAGVHVEDINVSIDRRKDSAVPDYDFKIDASGEVAIQGNHYPFDAQVEVKEGTTNYADVSLSVIGESNSQSIGLFDDTSYLPQGDFEPASASLVNGTFDDSLALNDFTDGGFEAGTYADNLITNESFEDSTALNLLPAEQSTFEGDTSGNVLANANYEETNVLYNADFEGVDGVDASGMPLGWMYSSNISGWVATGDPGPSGTGSKVACVTNTNTNNSGYNFGLIQNTVPGLVANANYKLSGYVRPDSTGSKAMVGFNVYPYLTASKTITPDGWTYFEVTGKATNGISPAVVPVTLGADKNSKVCFDDVVFERTSGGGSDTLSGVKQPDMVETFDGPQSSWGLTASSQIGRVQFGGDNWGLKTDGCSDYWTFGNNKRGYVSIGNVPYDMSVNVYLAVKNGNEERANVGFLLSGAGSSASGYMFRLKSAGSSGSGGFHAINGGTLTSFGPALSNIAASAWHNLRLIGWGSSATAVVTNLATNTVVYRETVSLPQLSNGNGVDGYFGQFPDSKCADNGQYWDNFQIRTMQPGVGVVQNPSNAHSGNGYATITGGGSGWASYSSVGEPITAGRTYAYSAWVRAASGTVSGNIALKGISNNWGATVETINSRGFTVGTTWTQVRIAVTADLDYPDVAVGFYGMTDGATIYVDDQSFQRIPYERYAPSGSAMPLVDVVPDPTDSTNNVMSYVPLAASSAAYYWVGKPFSTTRYHLTARIRTIDGSTLPMTMKIYDGTGGVRALKDISVTGAWQDFGPVDLTSGGGPDDLRVAFETGPASNGFYIDDVVLTATETTSTEGTGGNSYGTLGKLTAPKGWSNSSTSSPVELVNSPANARSGQSFLRIGKGQSAEYHVPTTLVKGQTYTSSVWLKAPDGNTKADVWLYTYKGNDPTFNQAYKQSVDIKQSEYTEVKLVLPITTDGADSIRLWVYNSGTDNSKRLALDDVKMHLDGMSLVDPWKVQGSIGLVSTDDSTKSHGGDDYLAVTSKGGSSLWIEPTVKATSSARTFSAWVRTPSGTTAGTISLAQSGGGTKSVSFTADTTWRQVMVTLSGVSTDSAKTFTSKISFNGAGTLWVDDLATRDVRPFLPTADDVAAGIMHDPFNASSPSNYLIVSAGAGKGVSAPTNVSTPILTGATYSVRAHVKAASGTVSGTIGLDFGNTAGTAISPQLEEGDSTNFTADDTWQQITATFRAPQGSFNQITPKFILSGSAGGTIHLDTVTVTPVQIALQQRWDPWWDGTVSGQSVDWGVWDDPNNAHDGSLGVLKFKTNGGGSQGMMTTFNRASSAGEVYSASVWARTEASKSADLKLEFRAQGNSDESVEQSVTINGDWQLINVRLPISRSHTNMRFSLFTKTPGVQIYVDDVSVVQNRWSVTDTANRTNIATNPSLEKDISGYGQQNGSTLTRTDFHSYTGRYSGELKAADPNRQGYVVYGLPGLKPSTTYTVSAYFWIPEGASQEDLPDKYDLFWFVDYGDSSKGAAGVIKTIPADYTKTMQWQRLSITMTTSSVPNANVRFMAPWDGGWYVDGLLVEETNTLSGYFEGTRPSTTLSVVGDGPGAYEGSGYAQLSTVNSTGASMTANATGSITGSQHYTAYVKSATGEPLQAQATLSGACTAASNVVTVTGDWHKLDVTCTIASSGTLTMGVKLLTPGGVLDVDSIRLSNEPEDPIQYGNIFGITTPLDHPESGYRYLWNDAFGIPGMHLWGFAVQIEVDGGEPGLGVQATVYQDPKKMPNLLYGTDWIKGDALINISEISPCFDFGFQTVSSTGQPMGNSGLSIADGALKAEDFNITFAPRGCAVGDYKVTPGASVLFDAKVGDGTIHFDLEMTKNAQGQPEFDEDLHITNLDIGGIKYHDLEMAVHVTPTAASTTYKADMQLPMGSFKGDFEMRGATVGADQGVHVDGSVQLTDWGWKSSSGKGFKVNVFDFDMSMDVGPTNCGVLVADAKANASANFASASNLNFAGHLEVDCGLVSELQISFDYVHGGQTERFFLDYDAKKLTLAGGVAYQFERKTSWKYFGHRYHRTARIAVHVDFLMDIANPAGSEASIGADIKIANGSGTFDCEINGQPNDSCSFSISVSTSYFGTHRFSESW